MIQVVQRFGSLLRHNQKLEMKKFNCGKRFYFQFPSFSLIKSRFRKRREGRLFFVKKIKDGNNFFLRGC